MKTQPLVRRAVEMDEEACACAYCHSVLEGTKATEGIVEVNTPEEVECVHSFHSYEEGSSYTATSAY